MGIHMHQNTKLRRPLWTAIGLLVAILLIGGVYWIFFKNRGVPPRPPVVTVDVAAVSQHDAPLQIRALGTVTSTNMATVRSRVDGELIRLHFTEGQQVKEGELLVELDPRPFQAELMQAEGQLLRDQALLENARLDLLRYEQLLAQNSIAQQQVDTQKALVRQYEGTVKLDQGAVDNARLQLTYSRITAPIAGRVGLKQVDLGNIVRTTDTNGIVTITQEEPINIVFSVPEADLTQVLAASRTNPKLAVTAWDRENRQRLAEGTLLAIDNQLNTSTGTINLKARFANTDHRLFPNQFVNIELHLGARPDAILVPTVAIQLGKLGHTVYRVNPDHTVSLVPVKTGPASGEYTIIEEGIAPGQMVVTDGLDRLRDGSTVRIVDRKKAAGATPAPSQDTPSGKPAQHM